MQKKPNGTQRYEFTSAPPSYYGCRQIRIYEEGQSPDYYYIQSSKNLSQLGDRYVINFMAGRSVITGNKKITPQFDVSVNRNGLCALLRGHRIKPGFFRYCRS